VRGGGRKPWRQKGTGRARHGTIRSPIWIGGGVTFGPRKERNYKKKVNKKVKRQAILMSLSDKAASKEIIVLEDLSLDEVKTKKMFQVLQALKLRPVVKKSSKEQKPKKTEKPKTGKGKVKKEKIKSVLLITDKKDDKITKSIKNIPRIDLTQANNLSLLKILQSQIIVITKKSLKEIDKVYS